MSNNFFKIDYTKYLLTLGTSALKLEDFCCITSLSHNIIPDDLYIVINEKHGNDKLRFLVTLLRLFAFLISKNFDLCDFAHFF